MFYEHPIKLSKPKVNYYTNILLLFGSRVKSDYFGIPMHILIFRTSFFLIMFHAKQTLGHSQL